MHQRNRRFAFKGPSESKARLQYLVLDNPRRQEVMKSARRAISTVMIKIRLRSRTKLMAFIWTSHDLCPSWILQGSTHPRWTAAPFKLRMVRYIRPFRFLRRRQVKYGQKEPVEVVSLSMYVAEYHSFRPELLH